MPPMADAAIVELDRTNPPEQGGAVRVTLRLGREDYERLKIQASEHDRTISAEARRAIRLYLLSIERRGQR